ncbi:MAG: cob(I)yrinic acid a c-diamide adenosyltransferase [Lachnospiraceae bacterium]|uniref:Cob(I)yrinic acid a,c-diamide adenosyltransferase n=1 Tax=Candidatus Weimeria bifida TaxID=2599074 RepID=A0A6N7IXH5_9FIRM|nr:cob(I)yrinic acid a,c-diamide adenosyltransferase [Candidatus Weimeria bifida]RRF94691.1 MAG: cob(I)yrinic acid a c-diamide adenosyltransferase [Lachnospiraceae bacterium]
MSKIQVYYGTGMGKTSAALGNAIRAASNGKSVYIIQFLKGQLNEEYFKRLEPEIKAFSFERSTHNFNELGPEEKKEEKQNILNGLGFAKKVLTTGECDILVLDEFLGLSDEGIISKDEMIDLISLGSDSVQLILTGTTMPEGLRERCDQIFNIKDESNQ